jgi:hypothetical protein
MSLLLIFFFHFSQPIVCHVLKKLFSVEQKCLIYSGQETFYDVMLNQCSYDDICIPFSFFMYTVHGVTACTAKERVKLTLQYLQKANFITFFHSWENLLIQCSVLYIPGNLHTDKKGNQIFLTDKEIQDGAVAKSYLRKGFLICICGNAQIFHTW